MNFGGNFIVREGYTQMFYARQVATSDRVYSAKDILVSANNIGKYRLPAVKSLDGRVEKLFTFRQTQLAFDVDVFNLLNAGTVLGRVYDVDSTKFNQVAEIMNPRIVRFGLRVQF